jgi:hypothetical protein
MMRAMRVNLLRLLPTLGGILITAALVGAATKSMNETVDVATIVAAIAAVATWLFSPAGRPASGGTLSSTPVQVELSQRKLAELVLAQWREEAEIRQLDDPVPIAVRWHMTELDIMDHPQHISVGRKKLQFEGRSDQICDLANSFRALPRRRLVILGGGGMGKTTLAVLLVRELLCSPMKDEPVPVLLSVAGFAPGSEGLHDWLANRLAEEYPALRAPDYGPTAIHDLVNKRAVMPVLDGLDEVPESIRGEVIAALNSTAADPIILTCRTDEYVAAIAQDGNRLRAGAVIEPEPLSARDVVMFLKSGLYGSTQRSGSWPAVLADLRSRPRGALACALATPLALWLLRKVYIEARADPGPLFSYPTAATIQSHLLGKLIPAVITANSPARRGRDQQTHPFRPRHRWAESTTRNWLGYLARCFPERDIVWWLLRDTVDPHARAAADAFTVGLVAGVPLAIARDPKAGLVFGLMFSLTYLLLFGFTTKPTLPSQRPKRIAWILIAGGSSSALVFWSVSTILFRAAGGSGVSAFLGYILLFPIGLSYWLSGHTEPSRVNLRFRGKPASITQAIGEVSAKTAFAFTLVGGLAFIVGEWLLDGYKNLPPRTGNLLGYILFGGVFAGLMLATVFALAAGFLQWAQSPLATDGRHGPRGTLRADLQVVTLRVVTVGIPVGTLTGLALWHAEGARIGLATAFATGSSFACMAALGSPSDIYALVKVRLWLTGRLPFRLMSFLEDMHRLGLVRQVGPVYQFRHADLQDWLANDYASVHGLQQDPPSDPVAQEVPGTTPERPE